MCVVSCAPLNSLDAAPRRSYQKSHKPSPVKPSIQKKSQPKSPAKPAARGRQLAAAEENDEPAEPIDTDSESDGGRGQEEPKVPQVASFVDTRFALSLHCLSQASPVPP